ncbi:zf-TFIIB domain-containing protein [Stratiformator vulcanicus]|uniref:Uncharacterized protein n=1 Tax=Stratiformator vulcanicus TaxID=2527980 RepID=A0A517R567_9PLAN|nr:zf-TFIIB domain-containing protein [Stratiformator vulcanicus]QDT39031.1 hypothetical protein Pan189_34320 [Stratiformator vulcanicus]
MNCSNCAAPLEYRSEINGFECRFCGSLQFTGSLEDGPDGIVPLGAATDYNCPRGCGTLSCGSIDEIKIVYCEECRGIGCDRAAFAHLVQSRRAAWSGGDTIPSPIDRDSLSERRPCPRCALTMEVHPYHGPGNAVIDSCGRCDLVWLDSGEVSAIERAPGRR